MDGIIRARQMLDEYESGKHRALLIGVITPQDGGVFLSENAGQATANDVATMIADMATDTPCCGAPGCRTTAFLDAVREAAKRYLEPEISKH